MPSKVWVNTSAPQPRQPCPAPHRPPRQQQQHHPASPPPLAGKGAQHAVAAAAPVAVAAVVGAGAGGRLSIGQTRQSMPSRRPRRRVRVRGRGKGRRGGSGTFLGGDISIYTCGDGDDTIRERVCTAVLTLLLLLLSLLLLMLLLLLLWGCSAGMMVRRMVRWGRARVRKRWLFNTIFRSLSYCGKN